MIGLTTQVNGRFVSRVTSAGQDFCSQKEQKIFEPAKSGDFVDWDVGPKVFCGDVCSLEVNVLHAIANRCVLGNGQTIFAF